MKKILILLILSLILTSCSKQGNMNSDILFERLGEEYLFENKIINEDEVICFNEDFVLHLKNNENNDIVNISISCDDINKKSEFMNFTENIIKIYAPEENLVEILKSYDNLNGLSTAESDWYTYLLVENEKGIYLSVNNNKLNPQSLPEYSLKTNENIENKKTH